MLYWLLSFSLALADPIRIAIVDTGLTENTNKPALNLCPDGHRSFTKDRKLEDRSKHGTPIAYLISEQLASVDKTKWCLIIIKYFDERQTGKENIEASERAFSYLLSQNVKYINYSSSGTSRTDYEEALVKALLNKGTKVFVAAGNDGVELSWLAEPKYYPAMYDKRIYVVGAIDARGNRSDTSNYGPVVKYYELGVDVSVGDERVSGTSFSTAIFTGKTVRQDIDRSIK